MKQWGAEFSASDVGLKFSILLTSFSACFLAIIDRSSSCRRARAAGQVKFSRACERLSFSQAMMAGGLGAGALYAPVNHFAKRSWCDSISLFCSYMLLGGEKSREVRGEVSLIRGY